MTDEREFRSKRRVEIEDQGRNAELAGITQEWMTESIRSNYSYHFDWLGRPIIQYPQDMIATQQIIWNVQPDLIIETGVARGGSIIFYASMLELLASCGGKRDSKVVGIDVDIRKHNRQAIENHPMSKRISLIEGSSTDEVIVEQVETLVRESNHIMVCLDSNHTHEHVAKELELYSSFVSKDSYLIVFDTIVEDLPRELVSDRPWSQGNNPKTAVHEFLVKRDDFVIDQSIQNSILISVAPDGYLKRIS